MLNRNSEQILTCDHNLALDEPFNFEDEELAKAGIQGIFNNFKLVEKDKAWTPRMVGEKVGFGGFGPMPVGTPEQVADVMEKWFIEGDVDGFNIQCMCSLPSLSEPFTIFTDMPPRHVQS